MAQNYLFSTLSAQQASVILDHAPVAIYVCAADSMELFYVNRMARKLFFTAPCGPGTTCYQLAGFDKPCPFCTANKMSRSQMFSRKFRHPVSHRVYQLNGQLIEWEGKPAHIEYITDITEEQAEEEKRDAFSRELQETFSSIPCGLCVYRVHGNRIEPLFHNTTFYEIIGYSSEDIRFAEQNSDYLGVHPEDLPLLQEKIQEMLAGGTPLRHIYRVWNDRTRDFHWIQLEGSIKTREDGVRLFYGVYSDVSEQHRLEMELRDAYGKMQDIIKAIPGGVAIYRVRDIFETVYFSDALPELTGYTPEEYREMARQDAANMIYPEDREMVTAKARAVIESHQVQTFEFRKQHRDGSIVWVRVRVKWLGEEEGCPLLHCVFHNISETKEAQLEMEHLVNSIPGGIASYVIEGGKFIPVFYSDGVLALSGYTREEFGELIKEDALEVIYEADRERVMPAAVAAVKSGEVLDVSYRMRHKNGELIWIHLNGRRMGPLAETTKFYAVFTGMSAEAQLFRDIANETADGIYVIDRENYELLYANESKKLFQVSMGSVGRKCYEVMYGRETPCDFCTMISGADGREHVMEWKDGRNFSIRFIENNWNGIPASVMYVRDVTDETHIRREKERLEQYFENVIKYLPGGVAVIHYMENGDMMPEFLSDGFARMTGMTFEEAWEIYGQNAMAGVHPEDRQTLTECLARFMAGNDSHCELVYRLKKGDGGYLWIKNSISVIRGRDGENRIYANYHDITKEREEQETLRQQYNELIMQHYRTVSPDVLILGHCNITRNQVLEIDDQTDYGLLSACSPAQEEFFTGLAGLVVNVGERRTFLETFLNKPALSAFERGNTELSQECFVKLPGDGNGRYARFTVNMVREPDTGDIMGILTVRDITEQVVADRILHHLSVASYDYVIDLDLAQDTFAVLAGNKNTDYIPQKGCYSAQMAFMLNEAVVPKDRERYAEAMDPEAMLRRLKEEGAYTFSFSLVNESGDIRTKNMAVSAVDLEIKRVCIVRTDITESVQEQRGLLNVVAYTFELLAFIRVDIKRLTLHTRRTVLDNLPPFVENYDASSISRLIRLCGLDERQEQVQEQFRLDYIMTRLEEKPAGYDFVMPFRTEAGLRYKQINVLWGDENHQNVCMVRADVTDMLSAEYQAREALRIALDQAEKASRAKSDFLSSMSHDIRTPMNAIIGMTGIAFAHLDERGKVEDCLQKISYSSKHLLNLINDILDMSKIERDKITLNREPLALQDIIGQLSDMLAPQAEAAGLEFQVHMEDIRHPYFYGDSLRLNQILINILGNALKFTKPGGRTELCAQELPSARAAGKARYLFTVRDTGIGMSEDFLKHIFEPFTRSIGAEQVEGTGLGLSITKGLVDLMKGEISVESKPDQGSVFRVELEFDVIREEDIPKCGMDIKPPACLNEELLKGRCFLIAEDNSINAEILCELLSMYGAASVVKTNGAQAVKEFLDTAPGTYDAILMDVQMPVMNGYEATRAIRAKSRSDAGAIPIIAMTANAFDEDIKTAIESGMTAHVAKPIDMQVFLATLNRVLVFQP